MPIGEAGSVTTGSPAENQPIVVTLASPLTNPVIILTSTQNGGDPFVLRVISETTDINGDTTSFTFIIEEWEYLDGPHPAVETINWLAVEEGVHTLADGRVIEAGTTSVSSTGRNTGTSETFSGGFTDPPVVLTTVNSNNDTTTVDSDPRNITNSGFDITLQEEEAETSVHAAEDIGWIAIEDGGSAATGTAQAFGGVNHTTDVLTLGDTFTNSIVLAETQTINGGDTATVVIDSQSNTDVGVSIAEEQSNDSETNHINETVGIVAFEQGLIITCYANGTRIATPRGPVLVEHLKKGGWVTTADDGAQKIRWIGHRQFEKAELDADPSLYPVRIVAHALGRGLPKRDLLVSRQHRMFVTSKIAERMFGEEEVLIAAIKLTALPGIYVDTSVDSVAYYHVLLDDHQILFAEGAPSESLYLGSEAQKTLSMEGWTELSKIFRFLPCDRIAGTTARYVPKDRRQAKLIRRHKRNSRRALI